MTDTPVTAVDAWLRTFASGDFDSWDQRKRGLEAADQAASAIGC